MVLRVAGISAGIFLLVILLVYGLDSCDKGRMHSELMEERRLARAAGIPTTPDDLRPKPPVPDSENAAILFKKAHAMVSGGLGYPENPPLGKQWKEMNGLFANPSRGIPGTLMPEEESAFLQLFAALTSPLSLVRQGSTLPRCDWKRRWEEGSGVLMPELTTMRLFARALSWEAAIRAQKGDRAGARADLLTVARISKLLRQEPSLLAFNVGAAVEMMALRRYALLAPLFPDDPQIATSAADLVSGLGELPDLLRALQGDAVQNIFVFGSLASAEGLRKLGIREEELWKYKPHPELRDRTEATVLRHIREVVASWPKDSADLDSMRAAISAHAEAIHLAISEFSGIFREFDATDESFLHNVDTLGSCIASRRLMLFLARTLEYRRANGSFPTELQAEGQEVIDPFTKKPLVYRRTDDGFLIYSLGPNQKDDGGQQRDRGHEDADDIAVRFPALPR